MAPRTRLVTHLILATFCCTISLGQGKPAVSVASAHEFPVNFKQSVSAGKTPVGSKIEAKLVVATLVNGKVIPRNAVFSGEVVESVAKSATTPSRLAIRVDSAQWKDGSIPIKLFLTAWYYPARDEAGQNLQYGPQQSPQSTWDGHGAYPDPNSPAYTYKPFPSSTSDRNPAVPETPTSTTSNNRLALKDTEAASRPDGTVALVSKRSNIKLDKLTTYILATGEPAATK